MDREVDTWSDTEEWTWSVGQKSRYLVRQGEGGDGHGQLDREVDTWSDAEKWIRSVGQRRTMIEGQERR